jgi:hypothetical protein
MIRAVKNYLAARHAAGFELKGAHYLLHSFARFATARRETHIRTATAIDLGQPHRVGSTTRRAAESGLPLCSLYEC